MPCGVDPDAYGLLFPPLVAGSQRYDCRASLHAEAPSPPGPQTRHRSLAALGASVRLRQAGATTAMTAGGGQTPPAATSLRGPTWRIRYTPACPRLPLHAVRRLLCCCTG